MQCTAILRSGRRCTSEAEPGSDTCALHNPNRPPPRPRPFYAERFSIKDRKALEQAAELDGLAQEIALLRTLMRERAAAGDIEAVRRAADALARLIRQQRTAGPSTDALDVLLEQALDDLDNDEP